ncbi:MAG: hypothetical protein U0871_11660 [Gemmataceae bacterium]
MSDWIARENASSDPDSAAASRTYPILSAGSSQWSHWPFSSRDTPNTVSSPRFDGSNRSSISSAAPGRVTVIGIARVAASGASTSRNCGEPTAISFRNATA